MHLYCAVGPTLSQTYSEYDIPPCVLFFNAVLFRSTLVCILFTQHSSNACYFILLQMERFVASTSLDPIPLDGSKMQSFYFYKNYQFIRICYSGHLCAAW